ncbi:unnamed protein product [Lathyrus sativus]|nr:unnamed protein product [Lathyrus sativus]
MELDNLVKQLSTSRPKDQNCVFKDGVSVGQNLSKNNKVVVDAHKTQPQQHKKQVRRRLHTTKPYQERLMNMAEARREIVTALKFHRASMKEASEQQKKKQQQDDAQEQLQKESLSHQSSQQQSFEQDGRYNKFRRNHRIYPSCRTNSSTYFNDSSYVSVPNSYTWPATSEILPPPTLLPENPNFILPNQTLGLNLNFHDFNNLDITVHLNSNSSSSSSSYSPGTSSSSASQDIPSVETSQVDSHALTHSTGGLHTAMNDEAIAEIRSIGDQHQMEWNDTMSLVQSACWFKYLKHMEHGAPETKVENDDFEQPLEFPAWLNANESCLELCSENSFQDYTLPCMDIGEIDCMDDDWLAG